MGTIPPVSWEVGIDNIPGADSNFITGSKCMNVVMLRYCITRLWYLLIFATRRDPPVCVSCCCWCSRLHFLQTHRLYFSALDYTTMTWQNHACLRHWIRCVCSISDNHSRPFKMRKNTHNLAFDFFLGAKPQIPILGRGCSALPSKRFGDLALPYAAVVVDL